MCCFSRPVYSVSNTEIFVCDAGVRQITVYGNRVQLKDGAPTAMILPVPCSAANAAKEGCGITVHDMSHAGPLFERMFELFPSGSLSRHTDSLDAKSNTQSSPLAVHRSGSYRYTIVPTLADFGRLRREVFSIDPASPLAALFAAHYASGFAFLVCIIDASATFAPIAYEHDKHASGAVFVPTRHYHGDGADEATAHDWDHQIVSLGCVGKEAGTAAAASSVYFRGMRSASVTGDGGIELAAFLAAGGVALPFMLPPLVHESILHRRTVKGSAPNDDIWLTPESELRKPGRCTVTVTGREHVVQDWYTCATCAAAGAFAEGEGACLACAQRCHEGHVIMLAGRSAFYCDCGLARGCLCAS